MARILVVDDAPDGRTLLAKRLRAEGHEVVEAKDGVGALQAIEGGDLDLALVDARMPPPDGFEVCRRAKALLGERFLPIIMVTAQDDPQARVAAFDSGAEDYLAKPFHPSELAARIRAHLRTRDLQASLSAANRELAEKKRELELANERLRALATTDGLTGLLNHRRLQERLHEEAARARRQETALSGLMADIDCFKRLNDTRGHLFGDRVLQHVAQTIRHSLRGIDVLGRYGGEEFGALLIDVTKEEAIEAAERVRSAVESTPFQPEGHEPCRLTVSVGVATFPEDVGDPDRILALADMALYAAKRNGRNRVERLARHVFEYRPAAGEVVSSVTLAGDFNGWNRTSHPLVLGDDGVWRITAVVPTGRLRYKFYLNAEHWVPDPAAKITETDAFKEPISVVVVKDPA